MKWGKEFERNLKAEIDFTEGQNNPILILKWPKFLDVGNYCNIVSELNPFFPSTHFSFINKAMIDHASKTMS